MKRILITGKNSYIGTSFENWITKWEDQYQVDVVGTMEDEWKTYSFNGYDVVLHVAGIAHIKESKKNSYLYYKVNRDMAYEVAKKAKLEGVKQLIFLSSVSVYGISTGIINLNTIESPITHYGKSKLEAERLIFALDDECFKVTILRPPMVYGKHCKGNFQKLLDICKKTFVFPEYNNSRSMIYIDNLCEFIRYVIELKLSGILFPQNSEYVCTSSMVKYIAKEINRSIFFTRGLNLIIKIISKQGVMSKIFGNLFYEKEMSLLNEVNYNICNFEMSIKQSV